MVKIRTQIEDTLTNSKLNGTEKFDILERDQEKYCKLKESMRPSKMTFVEEAAQEHETVEVELSTAPMFKSLKLSATRC